MSIVPFFVAVFAVVLTAATVVDGMFVGGHTPIDINNPKVQNASILAVRFSSSSNGSPCPEAFVLYNATKQVVAGVQYTMTYKITPDNCPENSKGNLEDGKVCTISVWSKAWANFNKVQTDTCNPQPPEKKGIIGGDDHDIGNMGVFKQFVKKYNKVYASEKEYNKRFRVFHMNMKKVKKIQETEKGTAKYGATQFADLTEDEFKRFHLGLVPHLKASNRHAPMANISDGPIPESFDWRDRGVVTPVKNQGMCGSCWAFSVTGNVEGQWAAKKGNLLSLSEQELVDCDSLDHGCMGGEMTNAYEQIIMLGGLETEDDYPYDGKDEKCSFASQKAKVQIAGYQNISRDEAEMAKWLYENGPISIGINANVMQFYFGGISHPWKILCEPSDLDHGVLIVGYGQTTYAKSKKVIPFWIIKNSWSSDWGENGYYRVYRGDGTCGLNLMASSAILN